jgi:hypothetical protein
LPVFSESIWSDGAVGHKRSSYFRVSHRVQARTRTACDKVLGCSNTISMLEGMYGVVYRIQFQVQNSKKRWHCSGQTLDWAGP